MTRSRHLPISYLQRVCPNRPSLLRDQWMGPMFHGRRKSPERNGTCTGSLVWTRVNHFKYLLELKTSTKVAMTVYSNIVVQLVLQNEHMIQVKSV